MSQLTPRLHSYTKNTKTEFLILEVAIISPHVSIETHLTIISPLFHHCSILFESHFFVQVYSQARPVSSMRFPQRGSRSAMAQRGIFGDNMFCYDLFMWWVRIDNLQLQPFFWGC